MVRPPGCRGGEELRQVLQPVEAPDGAGCAVIGGEPGTVAVQEGQVSENEHRCGLAPSASWQPTSASDAPPPARPSGAYRIHQLISDSAALDVQTIVPQQDLTSVGMPPVRVLHSTTGAARVHRSETVSRTGHGGGMASSPVALIRVVPRTLPLLGVPAVSCGE